MTEEYEPKLVGFLCNWCSYAGADLAGVSRFQYPTNLRIIRVMCSGRVHPAHILEAFKDSSQDATHPTTATISPGTLRQNAASQWYITSWSS
jgi:F420-non-reducing hydrogenase iron-sulfur subunit